MIQGEQKIKMYGENCSNISKELINYPEPKIITCLKNKNGKKIIYHPWSGYSIFSDDPKSYLTVDDLNCEWEEFNWFTDLVQEHNIRII